MIPPGSNLGLLGGGQLARMTALAGRRMGYKFRAFDPAGDAAPAAPVIPAAPVAAPTAPATADAAASPAPKPDATIENSVVKVFGMACGLGGDERSHS